MINESLKKTKHYVVIGIGLTGVSCVRLLTKYHYRVSVVDTRQIPKNLVAFKKEFPHVPITLGSLVLPQDLDIIVLSPGLDSKIPVLKLAKLQGIPIIGDIELFSQHVDAAVVAITGSNGKSTVATLFAKLAEACGVSVGLGGNIGVPALSLLEKKFQLYVLELSSFQLETTYSLEPNIAIILNVTPDHLDRYENIKQYRLAKLRIYHLAKSIVYNRGDPHTWPSNNTQKSMISFGLDAPKQNHFGLIQDENARNYLAKGKDKLFFTSNLKLLGKQNILNVLASLALIDLMGLSITNCLPILESFSALPHRCEILGKFAEVLWINDSKCTNVGAAIAAFEGISCHISKKIIPILGGDSKGTDLLPLIPYIQAHSRVVILFGKSKKKFLELLENKVPCYVVDTMENAVYLAKSYALSGDAVLLSPACASFDMFKNFQVRGNIFKQAVEELVKP